MKGTPQFPQCGFSATVAEILKRCGVTDYFSVNVLADDEIRQGIKEYANWPTIPQLYVNGEFVGGCDIMREMYCKRRAAEAARDADRLTRLRVRSEGPPSCGPFCRIRVQRIVRTRRPQEHRQGGCQWKH